MTCQPPYIDNIIIKVKSQFLTEQSSPDEESFAFSYTITITNQRNDKVTLKSRSWLITDANGEITSVEGEGVVGQQPTIEPGKDFTYTSGCLLKTPIGTMQGYYLFEDIHGDAVKAPIDAFRLAVPNIVH